MVHKIWARGKCSGGIYRLLVWQSQHQAKIWSVSHRRDPLDPVAMTLSRNNMPELSLQITGQAPLAVKASEERVAAQDELQ